MKLSFRFSLRTLLLAAICAGCVMLVWRVREPFAFKHTALSKGATPTQDEYAYFDGRNSLSFSSDSKYLLFKLNIYSSAKYDVSNYEVFNVNSVEKVLPIDEGRAVFFDSNKHWIVRKHPIGTPPFSSKFEYAVQDLQSGQPLASFPGDIDAAAHFSHTGRRLMIDNYLSLDIFDTNTWTKTASVPRKLLASEYLMIDDGDSILMAGTKIGEDGEPNFAVAQKLSFTAIDCLTGKIKWKWNSEPIPNFGGFNFTVNEDLKQITYNVAPSQVRCIGGDMDNGIIDYSDPASVHKSTDPVLNLDRFRRRSPKAHRSIQTTDKQFSLGKENENLLLYDESKKQVVLSLPSVKGKSPTNLTMANDASALAALLGEDEIGIWTRRRPRLDYWGMHAQPEPWLALFMFGLLFYSVIRNWREARS